jgi:serine/threonine protein kinase
MSAISNVTESKQVSPANSDGKPSDQSLEDLVGSEYYISPEMLISRTYSYATDLWALGVIVY